MERWALWLSFLLSLGLGVFWVTGPRAYAEESSSDSQPSRSRARSNQTARTAGTQQATPSSGSEFTLKGWDRFGINYFFIFYGPSLGQPSSYQPRPNGEPDFGRPILFKNFATLSYTVSKDVGISGTAYWFYQPVLGQSLTMRDPYLRVSHDHLLQIGPLNLYADARVHLAVTDESRNKDLMTGLQTFQVLTYDVPGTRLQLGAFGSARLNIYGSQGFGPDLEFYLGPNLAYRLTDTFELTLLYEMGMSHFYGDPAGRFYNDGTDLEPGFRWQITPSLMINPYVNLYPGDKLNLASSSFGMMLNWNLL